MPRPKASVGACCRMVRASAWKLIGNTVFYGLMIQLAMIQSKALLCRLCKSCLQQIGPNEFWVWFLLFMVCFSIFDFIVVQRAKELITREKSNDGTKPAGRCLFFGGLAKYTRSGAIYGYM